uniref:Uncharacterized protein n=1 Tax=Rhodopseudomonas palustris (strain BisA53) TaxID=316055 RepID=Q07H55_RHOP5
MLAVALTMLGAGVREAPAQKALKNGDILSGQLNALRSRAKGKRVPTFQLVSEPRRLPPPGGLCNLETGPMTFQLVADNDAQAAQLKGLLGKEVSVRVKEMACAEEAGQISEAVVTKWSVVATP